MSATENRTLVLSQGYEPLKVIPWERAITLLFLGKIEVIEEYDHDVRSTSLVIKMPAVVRLISAFRRHKKKVKFSRVNIFGRDKYKCQYCGDKGKLADLTYDHVVPKSRGGKTTWKNIVTCCYDCNSKKGDKSPQEAGMRLRKQPVQPSWLPSMKITIRKEYAPSAWASYLYWTSELEP
jgi:5-methylcytosine-specific restriction endonuclease McrA